MRVQFELEIGTNKFTLIEDVESHTDFFKKLSFYSGLPKVGPNGETDLEIRHRVAQKQYDYYSIVSKKANMEFKFGQAKDSKGVLFPKGWEPIYKGDDSEDGAQNVAGFTAPQAAVPSVMTGIAPPQPAVAQAPTPQPAAPAPQAPAQAPAPAAAFAPPVAAAAAPTAPAVNPTVQAQASSILSKFGI